MLKFRQGYYADVRVEDRFDTHIVLRDGNLEECKASRVKRAFLRVYDGEMWYYASTSDTEDLQRVHCMTVYFQSPMPALHVSHSG